MDLVQKLKIEHEMILAKLNELSHVNIILPEGHQKVIALKELFMSHLQEEDDAFYPRLREACQKDPKLNELVGLFEDNMQEISHFAMEFFNKYLKGAVEFEFKRDFNHLLNVFQTRIKREETLLYPEYEKIT